MREGGQPAAPSPDSTAAKQLVYANGTTPNRLALVATHVVADAKLVAGRSGRSRWLLTWRCPSCSALHLGQTRVLLDVMRRAPACGSSHVLLHAFAERVVA